MPTPRIGVVLPAYNRQTLLGRAIESVLRQTVPDFELLVVDDGSTDDTVDLVSGFSDSRIQFIRFPANRGQAVAPGALFPLHKGRECAIPPQATLIETLPQGGIAEWPACCRVGLMLSDEEGGSYASSEYLLCGRPVVSTPSRGGLDVFYTDANAKIVDPPPACPGRLHARRIHGRSTARRSNGVSRAGIGLLARCSRRSSAMRGRRWTPPRPSRRSSNTS